MSVSLRKDAQTVTAAAATAARVVWPGAGEVLVSDVQAASPGRVLVTGRQRTGTVLTIVVSAGYTFRRACSTLGLA